MSKKLNQGDIYYNHQQQSPHPTTFEGQSMNNSPNLVTSKVHPNQIQQRQTKKQKIIDQNIKLKEQIFQLSQQLQEIVEKDKNRRKKLGQISINDDEQTLKQKKLQLKKQQLEIMQMRNKIFVVKRQLESIYNNRNMVNKEEQLRNLKVELRILDQEKDGLLKIKQQQTKNIKSLKNEEQFQERIQNLKKQFSKLKDQGKTINQKTTQAQRILRKNHEQYIIKQEKVRQIEQKIILAKERVKNKKPVVTVTPEILSALQEEISVLEEQRRENERLWQQKIKTIDMDLQQKKIEQEKKMLILKQKQKQYKLNELKIKELRKLAKYNRVTPAKKKNEQVDMSQFRYKRNIKYLDK